MLAHHRGAGIIRGVAVRVKRACGVAGAMALRATLDPDHRAQEPRAYAVMGGECAATSCAARQARTSAMLIPVSSAICG